MDLVLCICTCDRPAGLERVLGAVDGLVWPEGEMPSFAVVVVDNLPDGRARDVVERLRPAFRWPLHFVEEPERGISQARNRAVAEALSLGAESVAFIDDDDVPRPDWLWWLWQRQRETGADLVFGGWKPPDPDGVPWYLRRLKYFREQARTGPSETGGTGNVLLSAAPLRALGREGEVFRTAFGSLGGEDTDLFRRIEARGGRTAWCPESVVRACWDAERLSLTGMLRLAYRRGYGKALTVRFSTGEPAVPWVVRSALGVLTGPLLVVAYLWAPGKAVRQASKWSRSLGILAGLLAPVTSGKVQSLPKDQ